jgi:hypothetical protein
MLCYSRPIGHAMLEQKTKLKKKCVSYFQKKNYIKKNLDVDHVLIVKNFEKKKELQLEKSVRKTTCKEKAYNKCKCHL